MKDFIKHLITCRCTLPHLRYLPNSPNHKFIVFSELEENGEFCPSFAQCNNCGLIHKVTEVGESIILKKEESFAVPTIEEIKGEMPEKILASLSGFELDLHQWQELKWILDNQAWGRSVVLGKEKIEGLVAGKAIQIISAGIAKITSFSKEDIQEVSNDR